MAYIVPLTMSYRGQLHPELSLKTLITGAAGFIGMHSAIKFIDSGYDVIGIDNMSDYYSVELKHARLTNIKNHPN